MQVRSHPATTCTRAPCLHNIMTVSNLTCWIQSLFTKETIRPGDDIRNKILYNHPEDTLTRSVARLMQYQLHVGGRFSRTSANSRQQKLTPGKKSAKKSSNDHKNEDVKNNVNKQQYKEQTQHFSKKVYWSLCM